MLKQDGLRVRDGNHWVVLFPCLPSVHGAYWVGGEAIVANSARSVVFGVVEHLDRPVYIGGSLIFFMRFTKETLVRFQLCLFLDQVKLRFVLIDIGAWGALICFHRPKWPALCKELVQFDFL